MYFKCTYCMFIKYLNVLIIYFNVFIMCFNVFKCIYQHCNWNFTITYTLKRFYHAHPPIHLLFTIDNDSLPQHALPLHSFFLFPLICSNFHTIYEKSTYQFLLFTSIHHPTFHLPYSKSLLVAQGIAEPK
jgi:hypothetical protein